MDHQANTQELVGSADLLKKSIGEDLLPLALAVQDVDVTFGKVERRFFGNPRSPLDCEADDIIAFVDAYLPQIAPDAIVLRRDVDPNAVTKLLEFHEVVDHYAPIIANLALASIPAQKGHHKSCSETEIARFKKALYILHLTTILFTRDDQLNPATAARADDIEPAWIHFWSKFAPWELQQTRCAHDLLARHTQNVSNANPMQRRGKPYKKTFSQGVLRAFVINEGLVDLRHLEGLASKHHLRVAIDKFEEFSPNWARLEPWYKKHDKMYLEQTDDSTQLDVSSILAKHPEAESGPSDSWMHTLLQMHVDDAIFQAGSDSLFHCGQHAIEWGYAFWDRERLDAASRGLLPTTAEMQDVSDITVFTEDVDYNADFRLHSGCTCKKGRY
ncbi:hypothetical protein SLS62_003458 [Diatrype stigma]|uniref:Uncharacterized protein n=1 Tax=Diatrype stigma TaxID=117547 RepID=A0AAN9UUP8_9PEZI